MTSDLKDILLRGAETTNRVEGDLIISEEFADDCASSQSQFVSISYNPMNSTVSVELDMSNKPNISETIDIGVIIDDELVTSENDHTGNYTYSYQFSEEQFASVGSDIKVTANNSDKTLGCIFEYKVIFDPLTDLSVVGDNDDVYSLVFTQNAESTIPVLFNEASYAVVWSFNNVEFPADVAITNARARSLTSLDSGNVVATINNTLEIASESIAVDQSHRSITVDQHNVINGLSNYVNFYTTIETQLPVSTSYYLDGVILNESHIEYNPSLIGRTITSVLRPSGLEDVALLSDVLSDIELFYDHSEFTVEESNIDDDYLLNGYDSISSATIFNSINGIAAGEQIVRRDKFTIDDILNYEIPTLGNEIISEFKPVLIEEPIVWEEISETTGEVMSVKSFDRYGRERRESMSQLTSKTVEIFNDEHRYKYDLLSKYTDDSVSRFDGGDELLLDFNENTIFPKIDGVNVIMEKEIDSGIVAISGIINFQGLSSVSGSKVLVELYRDNILVDRYGFNRVGISTESLYRTTSFSIVQEDSDSRAFNFDYRRWEEKPNNIKIYMNQKDGDIFSLSEFELTRRV